MTDYPPAEFTNPDTQHRSVRESVAAKARQLRAIKADHNGRVLPPDTDPQVVDVTTTDPPSAA